VHFSTSELTSSVDGTLDGPETDVAGIATDSRSLLAGQLFVPLTGRRDGHAFIAEAVAAGAPAYLTEGPRVPGATAIEVQDAASALVAIGKRARDRLGDRVVGITGSVGKTTVKDLVTSVLSTTYRTSASPMSFNNEIGLPLTLANAEDDAEAVVVEMGARGHGHIRRLAGIARPTIGVVTRVGHAHTEQLGDLDAVARAKGELVASLPENGVAVLNADDPRVLAMGDRARCAVVLFGLSPAAAVTARDVTIDELARPSFQLVTPGGSSPVVLALHGRHQVPNALAAAAAGIAAGVPVAAVALGLSLVTPPRWRMSVLTPRPGIVVVNDAYNANPTSTWAALDAVTSMKGSRRIAVLGEMAELGASAPTGHREIADAAEALGIELVPYRTAAYGVAEVGDEAEVLRRLQPFRPGDVILVKGSRAAGLEAVVDALLAALTPEKGTLAPPVTAAISGSPVIRASDRGTAARTARPPR